ncbi:MAG: serine/arginine repetitive matrix protein 2 [Anaerovorax sp.]
MAIETTSLFYPEQKIHIGEYELTEGVEIQIYSAKDTYFDWAKLKLSQAFYGKITIAKGDKVEILLGYDGNLNSVFQGYAYKCDGKIIICKDEMVKLEQTKITNTFLDAEPGEIVEYCLLQAGVASYKLFENSYQKRSIVPISGKNVIQVMEEIKILWRIPHLFYFLQRTFHFGSKHVQEKIYKFEYGINIISLTEEKGQWILETASVPFIRHSDIIEMNHPSVQGKRQVSKVVFSSNEAGFLRTRIYFEVEK